MGAHGSKEKLHRSASERFVHTQVIERERFGSFGKRVKGKGIFCYDNLQYFFVLCTLESEKMYLTNVYKPQKYLFVSFHCLLTHCH